MSSFSHGFAATPPAAGTIDSTFTTLPSTDDGANVIAVATDDKLLIGGSFRNYGGVGRFSMVRLNADGTLDTGFNIGSGPTLTSGATRVTNSVARIFVRADGKILAAAKMDKWNEQPAANVVLLNDDGSQDLSFAPVFPNNASVSYFVGIDGGQVLMAGEPGAYVGKAPIFRITSAGAIDPTFQGMSLASLSFTSASVRLFAVQPDGKIVAQLTGVNGSSIGYRMVRMNADGSYDPSYANGGATLSREAYVMRAQADGKILVGTLVGIGYNGVAQGNLFRLNTDGSLDGTFDVSTSGLGQVTAILPQADGHILVAAGSTVKRLKADGRLDTSYTGAGFLALLNAAQQSNGKVVALGVAFGANSVVLNGAIRLNDDPPISPVFSVQPLAQTITEGARTIMRVTASGGGSIAFQWRRNGADIPNQTNDTLTLVSTALGDAGAYDVLATNRFGSTASSSVLLTVLPALPGSLYRESEIALRADSVVNVLEAQADGRLLVGGLFSSLNGVTRERLGKLNPDGSLDTTFANFGGNSVSEVNAAAPLANGAVLMGGNVNLTYAGKEHHYVLRFNSNGTVDTTFDLGGFGPSEIPALIAPRSSGQLVLGASASSKWNSTNAGVVFALTAQGELDTTLTVGGVGPRRGNFPGQISAVKSAPDGGVVVSGNFDKWNGLPATNLVRLNPDFSRITTFTNPLPSTAPPAIYTVQPDGKLLVQGNGLIRLNTDGSIDADFQTVTVDRFIKVVKLQADGRIILAGDFTKVNGFGRTNLARLNPNGAIDQDFNSGIGADAPINAVAIGTNNVIWIGGSFSSVEGAPRAFLARINPGPLLTPPAPPAIVSQPSRVVGTVGDDIALVLTNSGSGPFTFDWYFKSTGGVNPSDTGLTLRATTTSSSLVLTNVQVSDSGLYYVKVSNADGTTNSSLFSVIVNPLSPIPGSKDASFAAVSGAPQFELPDAKIIFASSLGLTRVWPDGSADHTFHTNAGQNAGISTAGAVLLSDGKMLLYGSDATLLRLDSEGILDTTFNTGPVVSSQSKQIRSVSIQADGKILVAGDFDSWGGFSRRGIVRLNKDGAVDESFNPGAGAEHSLPGSSSLYGSAQQVVVQADGKILLRGDFSRYNGTVIAGQRFVGATPLPLLIRLNADGTRDSSFARMAGASVNDLTLSPDGSIFINGFISAESDAYALRRLNADGSIDATFQAWPATHMLRVLVAGDGSVFIQGSGDNVLSHLSANGALDNSFISAPVSGSGFIAQTDGKLIAGSTRLFSGASFTLQARLSVVSRTATGLSFSWSPDYILQSTTSIVAPIVWTNVDASGTFTVSTATGAAFYRLVRKP